MSELGFGNKRRVTTLMSGRARSLVAFITAGLALASVSSLSGQLPAGSPPDFSGVYYPVQAAAAGGGAPGGRSAGGAPPARGERVTLPPPTRSAPTEDGSRGRPPAAPKLTQAYIAKWEVMRKSRMAGSSESDPRARCLPAGMPSMMNMIYGMEIMQTRDRVTIYGELNDMYRRIYLDGRKPSQKVLDDPTYAGYSVGRWQGNTLIVDTVALRGDSLIEDFASFSPHSEQMTVREEIRFVGDGLLEDRITVRDPEALVEPYVMVRTYRKSSPPNDELREFACAEGLDVAK